MRRRSGVVGGGSLIVVLVGARRLRLRARGGSVDSLRLGDPAGGVGGDGGGGKEDEAAEEGGDGEDDAEPEGDGEPVGVDGRWTTTTRPMNESIRLRVFIWE